MVVNTMLKKLLSWLGKENKPQANSLHELRVLLKLLAQTKPQEVSCDDVAEALAEFTEMQRRGENVAHLMPLVHHHLEMCPGCREEYEALMQALDYEAQMLA
jgi:hypothetical protein